MVSRLVDQNIVGTRWVFKNKLNADGKLWETKLDWLQKDTFKNAVLILKKPKLQLQD